MTRLSFFWVLCSKMAFASQKVLWRIPQTVLYIGLTVSCDFLGKWLLLQKRFCGGFRQRLLKTFVSQMAVASNKFFGGFRQLCFTIHLPVSCWGQSCCELLSCFTHTNPVHRKRPIMSLLLEYSLGLFFR